MLHAHVTGVALKTMFIRNGVEYPIAIDNGYDFNYQNYAYLNPELKLYPGDWIKTHCNYSTVNRALTTSGGIATTDEMCLSYLVYYPRTNLTDCESQYPMTPLFTAFATSLINSGVTNLNTILGNLAGVQNGAISFGQALSNMGVVWNDTQLAYWNAAVGANPQTGRCNSETAAASSATITTPYVPAEETCPDIFFSAAHHTAEAVISVFSIVLLAVYTTFM